MIGHYSGRQQVTVLKALRRERGEGWARDLTRAEYHAIVLAALVTRYGAR